MPTEVYAYQNSIAENQDIFWQYGNHCLIVTGKNSAKESGALDDVIAALEQGKITYDIFDQVEQNPHVSTCFSGGKSANNCNADFIVGIGGGSALDAAKAVAVFAANPDHLDKNFIFGNDWEFQALPLILVGTTAGTGSEVTPYSILINDDGQKQSIKGSDTYAEVAFGDPRYTQTMQYQTTVSTALDAICHSIESYFSTSCDTFSEMYSLECLRLCIPALQSIATKITPTLETRQDLYNASIYGGLAINISGTALCHGMGYPLSETKRIPHGLATAIFLPEFIRYSVPLAPDKAKAMFDVIGMSEKEFADFVYSLIHIKLGETTPQERQQWVHRCHDSINAKRCLGEITKEKMLDISRVVLKMFA